MTKIMLVEDDKSLREIYGVRLLAEGYDIVSAGDGEEALAMAIKERPVLIVTDVMMPKISGFDMLDILRSTTETKNIKVIVMTALGSEEQRIRGDQLGADRYLVKSQVGIEDVVRAVHEVLGDKATAAPTPPTPGAQPPVAPMAPPTMPTPQPPTTARAVAPAAPAPMSTPGPQPQTQRTMASTPQPPQPQPQASVGVAPTAPQPHIPTTPPPPSGRSRIIQPLSDAASSKVDINELLDRELAKEAGLDINDRPSVPSAQQERAIVQDQLQQFSNAPAPAPNPVNNAQPTIQIDSQGRVSGMGDQAAPAAGMPPTPPPPIR